MEEKRQYVNLDQFSTEELEEMLSAEIEATENGDDDFVLHILEVIEQRESENPTGRLCDVDKAWADFQKYYQNAEGIGQSLYPNDLFESSAAQSFSKRRPIRRMLRKLPFSAAMVAVTLSIMIVAQAAGFDVCGAIAKWTDETFHFASSITEDIPEGADYSSVIKEGLNKCGISPTLAPTWFKEGFYLHESKIAHTDYAYYMLCSFQNDQKEIYAIDFEYYYSPERLNNTIFEKDNTALERYSNGEQTFFIMSNLNTITATCSNGNTCISIYGKLTTAEVKKIIDSIGGKGT